MNKNWDKYGYNPKKKHGKDKSMQQNKYARYKNVQGGEHVKFEKCTAKKNTHGKTRRAGVEKNLAKIKHAWRNKTCKERK